MNAQAQLSFKPFAERGKVRIYYNGFLPHWRQDGCTYFVTFRTADSIPNAVYAQWQHERKYWLAARGFDLNLPDWKAKFRQIAKGERESFKRSFSKKLFEELDNCAGECVLRKPDIADIVQSSLEFFDGERLALGDSVIMPNHIHMLMTPFAGHQPEDILHSIKSYSANRINERLGRTGNFWMNESHDHLVRDGEELKRIQVYIRKNPEKAKLRIDEVVYRAAQYDLTS